MPASASPVVHQEDTGWQLTASCRDADGDWDIEPSGKPSPENQAALEACAACLVREACLAFALATEGAWPRWGIWGGTVPEDR